MYLPTAHPSGSVGAEAAAAPRCTSSAGYSGDRCELSPCLTDPNWCNGHGTCAVGACTCACPRAAHAPPGAARAPPPQSAAHCRFRASGLHAPVLRALLSHNSEYEFSFGVGPTNIPGYSLPVDYWLIHGWVTVPKNATQFTDSTINLVNRSEISSHVNEQVKQYFNQQTDMLSF